MDERLDVIREQVVRAKMKIIYHHAWDKDDDWDSKRICIECGGDLNRPITRNHAPNPQGRGI